MTSLKRARANVEERTSMDGVAARDLQIDIDLAFGASNVVGPRGAVRPDDRKGSQATVAWASLGAVDVESARVYARAILEAADLVEEGLKVKLADRQRTGNGRRKTGSAIDA